MMRELQVPRDVIDGATARPKRVSRDPIIAGNAGSAGIAGNADAAADLKKLTIRLDADLLGRIRAAWIADLAAGSGLMTLSAWAAHHLAEAVIESEQRTNGGVPREPLSSGVVPRGRHG